MELHTASTMQSEQLRIREFVAGAEAARNADETKLRSVSKDFEALFVKMMLNSMRNTVQKSGMIDGGFAEGIYEDMLYDEYSKKISDTARLGIAETLYNQMSAYL